MDRGRLSATARTGSVDRAGGRMMSDDFEVRQPPRLSIVIPAPSDTAALEDTLVSVLENRPDDCEIVVALGCEYADPWNIREEVRFVQAPVGSGIVSCTNLGIAASAGDVVHILAAGWRATEGWTEPAMEWLERDDVAAVVPLGVAADDRDRVVSAGVRCAAGGRRIGVAADAQWKRTPAADCPPRGAIAPMGPVLETGFWKATVVEFAGRGFSTVCGDAAADADMAVTLARSGQEVVFEPTSRVVAAADRKTPVRSFAAGLQAERLFWRSLAGQPLLTALLLHAVEIVRHAAVRAPLGTLPMLAGRLVAFLQFGSYVSRYRQLRDLMAGATQPRTDIDRPTIRIDAAHAGIGRPRQGATPPLRRSA